MRGLRVLGVLLLITGLLVSLAASASASTSTQAASTSATTTASVHEADATSHRPKLITHPVAQPRYQATAITPGKRATAARAALADASVASTCSGAISANVIYPCESPSSTGTDTFSLTLADTTEDVFFRVLWTGGVGQTPAITLTSPGGSAVSCELGTADGLLYECTTSEAGTYALAVTSDYTDYTLEFTPLLSDSGCAPVTTSFTAAPITGSVVAGQTGNCYSLTAPVGDVLDVIPTPTYGTAATLNVYDSSGAEVCSTAQGNCALTGTGTYRILASADGNADSYAFQLADLSGPAGCLVVAQQTFGQVPAMSANLCRTLTVTTAGEYQIYATDTEYGSATVSLFQSDGTATCTGNGPFCDLTSGTYYLVSDYLLNGDEFAAAFVAANQARGCVATNDTGFASGDATGAFSGPGEELCRTLPTAAGLSDYLINQPVASGYQAEQLEVVDASGTQVCPDAFDYSSYGPCALTGTAPFRVIFAPGGTDSSLRLLAQRTNSTAGCANWSASGFGNVPGTTVRLTTTDDFQCLVIPAGQHKASELLEMVGTGNASAGGLVVNDSSGNQVCLGNPPGFLCEYKPTVSYTALVSTDSTGGTYRMVRRDVTSSASCSKVASTAVAGPDTTFTLTSDTGAQCYRVTAAAADKFWFSNRTVYPSVSDSYEVPAAEMWVVGGSGNVLCGVSSEVCQTSGSTDYQIVLEATDYIGAAITVHLDTWLVGTAAGWVAACSAHQFSAAATWGPISGTITDKADGYCAVVDAQSQQLFDIDGYDDANSPYGVAAGVYPPTGWGESTSQMCGTNGSTQIDLVCFNPSTSSVQALFVLWPGFGTQDPVHFTLQSLCGTQCTTSRPPTVFKSISPSSQPAGFSNTVVLTGIGLSFASQVDLMSADGGEYAVATPESVNAAGTSLTAILNTSQAPIGTYDISPGDFCSPSPCSDWLIGAYKVTAAAASAPVSSFVAVKPARILTTSAGADKTVSFQVTGRAGVPTAHVAAVVLDVTAANPARTGNLTLYAGGSRPAVTSVEFAAHQTTTGLVTVPVSGGKVTVYNGSGGTTGLTADVVGYHTTAAGTLFTSVGPARIFASQVKAGSTATVKVAGAGGVPAKGATAVAADVTVTGPAKSGHLVAYAGTSRPAVSSLSFTAGHTETMLVIAEVVNGSIELYNDSAGQLNMTVDVVGYYSASGSVFQTLDPRRIMDTSTGLGGAGETILPGGVTTLWTSGISAADNPTAMVLSITVIDPQRSGSLTVFQDGLNSIPAAQSVSFSAGESQSSQVIVPAGSYIDFWNNSGGNVEVTVDLEGYYTS